MVSASIIEQLGDGIRKFITNSDISVRKLVFDLKFAEWNDETKILDATPKDNYTEFYGDAVAGRSGTSDVLENDENE